MMIACSIVISDVYKRQVCTKALYRILPERYDVKGGGFHVTRRTFATNLLKTHAGIDDVMDALGHRCV